MELKDKVALVTGSKGKLGPIWVDVLRKHGCEVITLDYDECDIACPEEVEVFFMNAFNEHKGINILINNAALDHPPSDAVSFFHESENIIDVNLTGTLNITEKAIPFMKERGGLVVNIGSILGNVAADWRNYDNFEKPVAYNVSKAGLIQLTKSIAVQYGRYNIRSVCISFAAVETGKFPEPFATKFKKCLPLGRFISKDSLEKTLLYACACDELTGQQILVDSGYTSW